MSPLNPENLPRTVRAVHVGRPYFDVVARFLAVDLCRAHYDLRSIDRYFRGHNKINFVYYHHYFDYWVFAESFGDVERSPCCPYLSDVCSNIDSVFGLAVDVSPLLAPMLLYLLYMSLSFNKKVLYRPSAWPVKHRPDTILWSSLMCISLLSEYRKHRQQYGHFKGIFLFILNPGGCAIV